MSNTISLEELKNLSLPCLPKNLESIRYRAKTQDWPYIEEVGKARGGRLKKYLIASLPAEIRAEIMKRQADEILAKSDPPPLPSTTKVQRQKMLQLGLPINELAGRLNDKQQDVSHARAVFVAEVCKMRDTAGMSLRAAAVYVENQIKMGLLPEQLMRYVPIANARSNGKRGISWRSLINWVKESEGVERGNAVLVALAPKKPHEERSLMAIEWLPAWLSERDMQRDGKVLSESGEHNLVETHKVYNKKGDSYLTMAYKAPDGSLHTTDRGFNYNAGRMNYRPDLDQYNRRLAHQFAKSEMGGAEFKAVFKQLSSEFYEVKDRLKIDGKPKKDEKIDIRNKLSRQVKFAAGVLADDVQKVAGLKRAIVWLSDDTLIKQVDSREGQDFGADYYAFLPDFLGNPEHIVRDGRELVFTTRRNGEYLWAVLKYIDKVEEIYLQSYRISNEKEIRKLMEKKEVLK